MELWSPQGFGWIGVGRRCPRSTTRARTKLNVRNDCQHSALTIRSSLHLVLAQNCHMKMETASHQSQCFCYLGSYSSVHAVLCTSSVLSSNDAASP